MAQSDVKDELQNKVLMMEEMCLEFTCVSEEIQLQCESARKEVESLKEELAALKPDHPHFAPISAKVADMTSYLQQLETERLDLQARLEGCRHEQRELQQRIDDMSAAP